MFKLCDINENLISIFNYTVYVHVVAFIHWGFNFAIFAASI